MYFKNVHSYSLQHSLLKISLFFFVFFLLLFLFVLLVCLNFEEAWVVGLRVCVCVCDSTNTNVIVSVWNTIFTTWA